MTHSELTARLVKRGLTENQAQEVMTELVLQNLIYWDDKLEVRPMKEERC